MAGLVGEGCWQDVRYAARRLLREPVLTGAAVALVGVAVGATTATFSVLDAVLLRPLPYPDADRLVQISEVNPDEVAFGQGGFTDGPVNAQNYLDYIEGTTSFAAFGWAVDYFGSGQGMGTVAGGRGPTEAVGVVAVSPSFFDVLGVAPPLGRAFLPDEIAMRGAGYREDGRGVVILSHELWSGRYAADPEIVGQEIVFDGGPSIVVGVLPAGFRFPPLSERDEVRERRVDLYIPRFVAASMYEYRDRRHFEVIARMRPGVSEDEAQADLERVFAGIRELYPESQTGWSPVVTPLSTLAARDYGTALYALFGLAALVLLVACANLAALLLARGTRRSGELAVRAALGGGRGRLLRLLVVESVLLSLAGGVAGVLLARWGLGTLIALVPAEVPRAGEAALDGRVLAFAALLSLGVGVGAGLLPGLRTSDVDLARDMKGYGRTHSGGSATLSALLTAQVALTLALLLGASVLAKSFARLRTADPGYDPRDVLTVTLERGWLDEFHEIGWWDVEARRERWRVSYRLMERLRSLPGVRAVASGDVTIESTSVGALQVRSGALGAESRVVEGFLQNVSPEYFSLLGIPLLRGDGLEPWNGVDDAERYWRYVDGPDCRLEAKRAGNPRVGSPDERCTGAGVLVSETFAAAAWPGEDPLGREIGFAGCCWRVAGVVADVRSRGVDAPALAGAIGGAPEAMVYVPYTDVGPFLLKVERDPLALAPGVQAVMAEMGVEGAVTFGALEERVADSFARPRFYAAVALGFAGVGLLIAMVGVFGIVSFAVGRRVREIGVRMALGADAPAVRGMVLTGGMSPVLWGMLLGLALSAPVLATLNGLLYGMHPVDPWVALAVALALVAVSAAACYLPARHASRIDPLRALAHE